MKKISFINTNEVINVQNRLFDSVTYDLGDGLLRPFSELREFARLDGYDCATYHVIPPESADAIVCIDMPWPDMIERLKKVSAPKYLYIFECPLIRPKDWNESTHSMFDRVFTYDRQKLNSPKYAHYLMPYSMSRAIQTTLKSEWLCLVASNKVILRLLSGYDDRRKVIEYFRQSRQGGFSLYGRGWEFYSGPSRLLNRLFAKFGPNFPWLKWFSTSLPFYRGALNDKMQTISKYKFIYCNENFSHPGYITEKIFDAMWAGSVPVYSGPPDINEFIPASCYVNSGEFGSVDKLVQHLRAMREDEYQNYLANIRKFLNSEKSHMFDSKAFYQGLKLSLEQDL